MSKETKSKVMKFKVIVEKDEDGYYVADVPELQGCHTQAKNKRKLMKRVREVIALCLEDAAPIIRKVDVKEVEIAVQNSKLILA